MTFVLDACALIWWSLDPASQTKVKSLFLHPLD